MAWLTQKEKSFSNFNRNYLDFKDYFKCCVIATFTPPSAKRVQVIPSNKKSMLMRVNVHFLLTFFNYKIYLHLLITECLKSLCHNKQAATNIFIFWLFQMQTDKVLTFILNKYEVILTGRSISEKLRRSSNVFFLCFKLALACQRHWLISLRVIFTGQFQFMRNSLFHLAKILQTLSILNLKNTFFQKNKKHLHFVLTSPKKCKVQNVSQTIKTKTILLLLSFQLCLKHHLGFFFFLDSNQKQ